jgi:hypothetical protein
MSATQAVTVLLVATVGFVAPRNAAAQSIAIEGDAPAYFLSGYSGIANITLGNGISVAFGAGRYNVPGFIVEAQDSYDEAGWKATAQSIQVLRVGYRFRGPLKNGPAVHAIVLNQSWRLQARELADETRFRPLGVGLSGGYFLHVGRHFYIYPTSAVTYNTVYSGHTTVQASRYTVARWQVNPSVHIGWEMGF